MSKTIRFNIEAKQKLLEGATILNDAVSSTLGPRGQNVAIDRGYDMMVVHDGVTVAKYIEIKDPEVNAGVRIVREAANKQVDEVGDGTTVVTILAQAIIAECLKITSTGVNAMSLRQGLEKGVELLNNELDRLAKPIKTLEEKIQIATISAEDKELGTMIADIIHKIGVEGVVTVDESKSADTYVEHQEGMQFDKGYISPYFITDPGRNEATVEDCYILLADKNVTNIHELLPLLNKLVDKNKSGDGRARNLVIIAPDVTDSALASCIATKIQGGMSVSCIAAPYFADKQKSFLQDIAALTGGTVVSEDAGQRFEALEINQLGRAARVTSTKDATLIVGGKGDKLLIEERVKTIRAELERNEGSAFEMEKLKERIGKLSSGVAVVKVGGNTEVEMKERKERALDAVSATKAAIEEGIVPGGEVVYLQARKILTSQKKYIFSKESGLSREDIEKLDLQDPNEVIMVNDLKGVTTIPIDHSNADHILYEALKRPFYKLLENAGMEPAKYEDKLKGNLGMDVTDGKMKDMIKTGIIDPVKVAKSAIKNAVSVAIQVMTVSCLITETPKEEKK